MEKIITYRDITVSRGYETILLTAIGEDGEYYKARYIGYSIADCKKMFYRLVNSGEYWRR